MRNLTLTRGAGNLHRQLYSGEGSLTSRLGELRRTLQQLARSFNQCLRTDHDAFYA